MSDILEEARIKLKEFNKSSGRGGPRPGAGRKAGAAWAAEGDHVPHTRLTITLPPDTADWLKSSPEGVSRTIARLVEQAMNE